MHSVIAEVRRRKVHRAAAFYAAGAWLLVQVATQVFPFFDLPNWSVRLIIVTAVIGFPIAVVISWFFNWTPEGWRLDSEPAAAPAASAPAAVSAATVPAIAAAPNSIAVLPFADMSEGRDQEYFSDGLAEELLNLLAQLPQLQVIARTSSFSFKSRDADVATIARLLNVAHVLQGSVRKSGARLRVTAQLIRSADSVHIWSQAFERELTDVFAVQDEIAGAVVAALRVRLLPDQHLAPLHRTGSTAAYEQFLLGHNILRRGRYDEFQNAQQAFRQTLSLDPTFAAAWAGLANTQSIAADFATTIEQRFAGREAALSSAERAIELAGDLADGYLVRGQLRYRQHWNWRGGMDDLNRALVLDPNRGEVLMQVALGLYCTGDPEHALAVANRATVVDPLSWTAWTTRGAILRTLVRNDEARASLERAVEISPHASVARVVLGDFDLLDGRYAEALTHFEASSGGHRLAGIASALYSLGRFEESAQALAELEENYAWGFSLQIAEAHAWRGDADAAFAWLDRACERRDSGVPRLRTNLRFARLSADPRYAALLKRLNFPPLIEVS